MNAVDVIDFFPLESVTLFDQSPCQWLTKALFSQYLGATKGSKAIL
jgi:hypothetical protein